MDQRLGWRINELLLVVIIAFQILDFFKLLSPFWDYVKKIVSWALIGYLIYLTSPSGLFFGEQRKWWDASVILAYFSLTLKNIIGFAGAARDKMLASVMSYVTFIPATETVEGVAKITVSEGVFNAFSFGMTPLVNVSHYAKPFVAMLTMNTPNIPFTIAAGEQTMTAFLQPFGLNGLVLQFYNSLIMHGGIIERVSFLLGAAVLLILGLYAALRFPVKERSVLGVLHEHGPISGIGHGIIRIFSVLFVMAAFFVLIFNLVVEWLAIAVDAPLAMIGISVYLLLAVQFHRKTHRHFKEGEVLEKVGGFGTNFLKDFAKLFTSKDTVLIGISGLLVLHLVVDIGTFIIPYITGFVDPLYFGHLGAGHDTIPALMDAAWSGDLVRNLSVFSIYAFNTIGILALLGLPAYIWYKIFRLRTRPTHEAEHEHHP
ncbi:hypothetical protein GOV07_04750, partial [Candidatus Woesearchaeota archaeon]|nr:hypothetical protein [Candidatus Woesearchaeota archaeon]